MDILVLNYVNIFRVKYIEFEILNEYHYADSYLCSVWNVKEVAFRFWQFSSFSLESKKKYQKLL